MKIGCHVSIAGGVFNAPANAEKLGCEVFQIFSRSPQGGPAPVLTPEIAEQFKAARSSYGFPQVLIHTPYFINFGSANPRIGFGSISIVRQELERASLLGVEYVVTHLGSYKDLGEEKGRAQVCAGLAKVLEGYKGTAQLLLENAAGSGEVIGGTFEGLAKILNDAKLIKYDIGVCFDTAHAFASGYDLRTKEAVKKTFAALDHIIGGSRLKAIHANDSKIDLGGKRDRHDHIGSGKIGADGFKAILHHPRLKKLNLYLETEHDLVAEDIKLLKKLRDKK